MIVTKRWYSIKCGVPNKTHLLVLLFGFIPIWYSATEV